MTKIKIYSMFDYLTDTDVTWRKADHKSTKIVKSVKGKSFNGHLEIKIQGQTRRFVHPDCGDVVNWIAYLMAKGIKQITEGKVCLVPVPNSHVTDRDEEYRTLDFARKVAEHVGDDCFAAGAFVWANARNPQHQAGGHRHKNQFINNLQLVRRPKQKVILIDDMVTSGSQMLACAHILERHECEVAFGMAVGKATEVQDKKPLGWKSTEYEQD